MSLGFPHSSSCDVSHSITFDCFFASPQNPQAVFLRCKALQWRDGTPMCLRLAIVVGWVHKIVLLEHLLKEDCLSAVSPHGPGPFVRHTHRSLSIRLQTSSQCHGQITRVCLPATVGTWEQMEKNPRRIWTAISHGQVVSLVENCLSGHQVVSVWQSTCGHRLKWTCDIQNTCVGSVETACNLAPPRWRTKCMVHKHSF